MPTSHRMRKRGSVSPTHTVALPSAFRTMRCSTGMKPEGRCPSGKFHSMPPEIHAPVMLMSPGFTVFCQ